MPGFLHPKRLAFTAIATAVILEVVLQIGSLVVWFTHTDASAAATSDNVVLCAGDSFTYGMGAEGPDGNYPAQLQERLRDEFGPSWSVVNVGYPSLNSREILERTVRKLGEHKVRFVCVLAGNNDVWSRPEPLTLPPPGSREALAIEPSGARAFRFEWRTLRMIRWLSGRLTDGATEEPEALDANSNLAGTQWSGHGFWIAFGDKGALQFSRPKSTEKLEGRWIVSDDTVDLTGLGVSCKRVGDQLLVFADGMPRSIPLEAHHPNQAIGTKESPKPKLDPNKLAWTAIRNREFDKAATIIEPALAIELAEPKPDREAIGRWRSALVQVYSGLSRRDDAEAQCQAIATLFESHPSPGLAGKYLSALARTGQSSQCLELGKQFVERFPDSQQTWSTYAWQLYQHSDDWEAAVAAAERALELTPTSRSKSIGAQCRTLVQLHLRRNPETASRYAVLAFRADHDRMRFRQATRWLQGRTEYKHVQDLIDDLLDDELREAAMAECAIGFGRTPKRSIAITFRTHMDQLLAHGKAAGAEVLLLSYPTRRGLTDPELEALGAAGASTLMLVETFRQQRHATPNVELFAPDGHCNDAGYGLIADKVFDRIRERLAK